MDERRRTRRFPLDLPLEARWSSAGEEAQKPATLQDISSAGLYFNVEGNLAPGSKVECDIWLPVEGASGKGVLLRCQGGVVRVDRIRDDPTKVGIGVRLDRYAFVRDAKANQ